MGAVDALDFQRGIERFRERIVRRRRLLPIAIMVSERFG
jgi:hypothetical protein